MENVECRMENYDYRARPKSVPEFRANYRL